MSTPVHKPAKQTKPFASYGFQENEENEDELEESDEKEEEVEWSDEEDLLHGDDDEFEVGFEDDYDEDDSDDEFENDYDDDDSDTEEDDHGYLDEDDDDNDDEDSHYKNNYSAGPGYFYPEQPYVELPIVSKPSPEASTSKLSYYVLSPICDIAAIYIKFAILAILIYACALWYTVYYGDLSSLADMEEDDVDTCPAI